MSTDGSARDDVALTLRRLAGVFRDRTVPHDLRKALRNLPETAGTEGHEALQVVSDSRFMEDRTLVRGATLSGSRLLTLSAPTIDLAIDVLPDEHTRRASIRGVVLPIDEPAPLTISIGLCRVQCDEHGQFRIDDIAFGCFAGTVETEVAISPDSGRDEQPRLLARFTLIVN